MPQWSQETSIDSSYSLLHNREAYRGRIEVLWICMEYYIDIPYYVRWHVQWFGKTVYEVRYIV